MLEKRESGGLRCVRWNALLGRYVFSRALAASYYGITSDYVFFGSRTTIFRSFFLTTHRA